REDFAELICVVGRHSRRKLHPGEHYFHTSCLQALDDRGEIAADLVEPVSAEAIVDPQLENDDAWVVREHLIHARSPLGAGFAGSVRVQLVLAAASKPQMSMSIAGCRRVISRANAGSGAPSPPATLRAAKSRSRCRGGRPARTERARAGCRRASLRDARWPRANACSARPCAD